MIIVLKPGVSKEDKDSITGQIKDLGLKPVSFDGDERTVINVIGNVLETQREHFRSLRVVEDVVRIVKPYKLASKEHHTQKTVIKVGGVKIGNSDFTVIAGPDSVESKEQILESARIMKENGIKIMRASAFKPRTSPYEFQGMGIEGLKLLKIGRASCRERV